MLIPLTDGHATIDADDFTLIAGRKWCRDGAYAKAGRVRMHTAIMGPSPPGHVIDHINGNGLDNRRENLRFVTKSQNAHNTHASWGVSRYRGVSFHAQSRKWRSQVRINGAYKHLGLFSTQEDARDAHQKAVQSF